MRIGIPPATDTVAAVVAPSRHQQSRQHLLAALAIALSQPRWSPASGLLASPN
jgi:hypothetical protein